MTGRGLLIPGVKTHPLLFVHFSNFPSLFADRRSLSHLDERATTWYKIMRLLEPTIPLLVPGYLGRTVGAGPRAWREIRQRGVRWRGQRPNRSRWHQVAAAWLSRCRWVSIQFPLQGTQLYSRELDERVQPLCVDENYVSEMYVDESRSGFFKSVSNDITLGLSVDLRCFFRR